MDRQTELTKEQQYTAHVQQLLLAVVERSRDYSQGHLGSIRALLADAWEELRLKPTALSVQDMEQLSAEVDRFLARKTLTDNLAKRYEAMLMNPFFAVSVASAFQTIFMRNSIPHIRSIVKI